MPIVLSVPEQMILLNLNQGPAPVVDIFSAVAFRATLAGVRLGVFDALDDGPRSPADLARTLGLDERGVRVLLDTLASIGYVRARGARFALTRTAAKWLANSSPLSVAAGVEYWGILFDQFFGNLERSIREGQPPLNLYAWIETQPEASSAFQRWMVATARIGGPEIIDKLMLPPGAQRVLDVGGGHGLYSIALCRKHPQLHATIVDSPEALNAARDNVDAAGLADRITLHTGDFLHESLGSGYDLALLFNIVHGFTPAQNTDLLRRVAGALSVGGCVAIAEQLAGKPPTRAAGAFAQMLGLAYFHLLGGRLYSFDEISGWLRASGFGAIRRRNLLRTPGNSIILGTRLG